MDFLKKVLSFLSALLGAAMLFATLISLSLLFLILRGDRDELGFDEVTVKTEHAVGILSLSGEILSSDRFVRLLKKAIDNSKIKALVVRVESPGGSVGASEEIYQVLKEADQKKPIVCSMGNIAASGGLYAALGCRQIVANEGTLTGSIGVILMTPNFSSVMDSLGLQMNVIKSGKYKDSGSPFRSLTVEDKELLQGLVDQSYAQFVRKIADSRKLDPDKVKQFADGRVLLGEQAKELGLIDQIGGVNTAAKLALQATGDESEPEIVHFRKALGLAAIFGEVKESSLFVWFSSLWKMQLLYR